MKRYIDRQILIAKLAALALLTLCIPQTQVRAQEMTEYVILFPSVGVALNQSLYLTLFNPNGPPVRAQVQVRHHGGMMVGFGDGSVRFVPEGVSESFEIKRSDILLPGEDRTGRIQLSVSISCARQTVSDAIDPLVASIEIIEVRDGTSNTILIGEAIPSAPSSGGGRDVLVGGSGQDTLMGFGTDDKLRVTLYNPQSSGPAHLPSRVKLFERYGSLIAQSPDLVIPPGEFRSFDIDRDALTLPGEPGTRRLQVRIRVETTTADPSSLTTDPRASGPLVGSFELIDNGTGRTTAHQNNLKQIGLAFHSHSDSRN